MGIHHCKSLTIAGSVCIILFAGSLTGFAQSEPEKAPPQGVSGWSSVVRGGGVVQTDTDLDEGGSYSSTRLNIEAGHGYRWSRSDAASLALSYSYDGYDFSGGGSGMAARDPWSDIHSFSISAPMRYGINQQWSAFLIPSVSSNGESGADFSDTVNGGALTGVSYRFGDRLTIGPGIGVFGQIEESATIIPILLINWKITDTISLETGRGLAASLGPGLNLNYRPSERWSFILGGRYEKLRFRLDSNGTVPGGVGEDRSFPLYGGCTYMMSPKASVSFVAGIEFGGELKLEDEDGERIAKESYDPAPIFGLTFNIRI